VARRYCKRLGQHYNNNAEPLLGLRTQTQLLAPRKKDDEVGPEQVRRFDGWRRIPKGMSHARKFPYELHAELGDGSREWVQVWRNICVETRNGLKEATSWSNLGILRPADENVMSTPKLKREVYDRLDPF
jgi:hypothetical protein